MVQLSKSAFHFSLVILLQPPAMHTKLSLILASICSFALNDGKTCSSALLIVGTVRGQEGCSRG